jgi:hypothetical protein
MTTIETILNARYGTSLDKAPTYAILWAAEQIKDTAEAKKELKRHSRVLAVLADREGIPFHEDED